MAHDRHRVHAVALAVGLLTLPPLVAGGQAATALAVRSGGAAELSAPPATPASCPNERFRASPPAGELPDCRAYEQVTPLDKDGIDATGTVPFVKAALDGGAATYLSNVHSSVFQEYTPHLARRDAGGWAGETLTPPSASGGEPELVGLAADLSEAFVRTAGPGKPPTTALLSRPQGGVVNTIVPFTAKLEPRIAGASADGSLVVFESPAALPGAGAAIPGEPNLYGWDRASGQVRLVGVFNDGSAPPQGAFAGSYDWVRGTTVFTLGEGGASRDYYTQDQHAVAASGAAVYFTAAATGQLYLRRNPAAAQSPLDGDGDCTSAALACTTRISASRRTNGAGPGGSDPVGPAPAAFMGASADGARAFFTSSEELTDDANTGPDQPLPGIVRAAPDGDPSSVEPSFLPTSAAGIAVDGSHIYWADPLRGSIGRATLDGGGAEAEFVSGVDPRWVAVDGEYVYWTSPGAAAGPGEGTIGRARLDGAGAPEPDFITGASAPQGIAVDSTHLFWADAGSHAIARAGIDGGSVEPGFHPLVKTEVPQGVAVDGSHLYWAVNDPFGYVSRSDLDGTHEIFKFTGIEDELRGIALDGGHVYWGGWGSRAIGRANLDLSGAEPQFIPGAGRTTGLAADGLHLYWASAGDPNPGNDLYRYDAESGELTDLTADPGEADGAGVRGVLGVSADGSHAYFAANGVLASAPNGHGETAQPGNCLGKLGSTSGSCNLYVFHDGTIDFVARLETDGDLAESDAANWAATPTGVVNDSRFQRTARVAADGRTLLFRSRRQLTDYANGGTPELYRYRAGEPGPACLSCPPSGAAPLGAPTLGSIATPTSLRRGLAMVLARNLSVSGDRVFFESPDPLVEGDGDCPLAGPSPQPSPACKDVYEWEAAGSGSCASTAAAGGCLHLLSGQGGQPAFFADASLDGDDAFIFTRARLVDQDRDDLVDLYDARVNGGLEAQREAPPGCAGEGCRPASGTPPAVELPGTAAPGRRASRRPARRCSRVRHPVKRRCTKQRRRKTHVREGGP